MLANMASMSLISDVLRIRVAPGLACAAGPKQLGGLRDPRLAVAARQESSCRRRLMGLPICELGVDARFGFDGGRHVRFMEGVDLEEELRDEVTNDSLKYC